MTDDDGLGQLDDPAFLAARKRVRDELEYAPEDQVTAELEARYQAMTVEFLRRARGAWVTTERRFEMGTESC